MNRIEDRQGRLEKTVADGRKIFHLHLVSDSTGETLISVARAAAAQYPNTRAVEHVYSLVRMSQKIDLILSEIREKPGIVLYTLIDHDLIRLIEKACEEMELPCIGVLDSVQNAFQSYLGMEPTPYAGAQHALDDDYFRRIDALNFTILHDDGQGMDNLDMADVVLVGISRTSKTPTSIYLANRGIKTANIPIVPDIPLPASLQRLEGPLVVGLVASVDHILQIRRNRILSLGSRDETNYVDRSIIRREIVTTRELCAAHGWPILDVTRRSIEETAAAVIAFQRERNTDQRERNAES